MMASLSYIDMTFLESRITIVPEIALLCIVMILVGFIPIIGVGATHGGTDIAVMKEGIITISDLILFMSRVGLSLSQGMGWTTFGVG